MVFRLCGLSLYGQGDQNNNPDTVTDLKMTLKDEAHPDLFELSTDKDMDKSTSNLQAEDLDNVVEDNVDFVTAQNIINNDNRNGSSKILLNGNLKNSPNMKDTWINGNNDWAKSKKDIYDSSMTVINTDGFTKEYSGPQQAWSDHTLNNDKNQIVDNEVEENRNCCWICFFGRRKRNAVACSPLSDGESTDKTIVSEIKSVALTPHHVVPSPSTEDVLQAHVDIQKRQQELLFQLQQKQALLDRVSYGRDTPTNFSNAEIDGPRFVQRNVSSAPGNQREILDQIRTDTQDQNGSLPHISRPASTQTVKSYLQNKNEESTIMEAPNSLANGHGDSSISKSPQKFQKDSPVFSAMAAVSAAYPDYKTPRSLLNDKTEMHSRSPTPNNSRPITPSSIKESPYQTPERKIPKPTQIVRQNDDYVVQIETNGAQAATMRSKSRQEGSATPIRTPSPNQNGSLPPTPKRKINKSVPTTPKSTGSSRAATPQRYADSPKSIASRAVSYQGSPAKKDDSGYISSSKTRDDDVPFVVKVHPKRFTDGDSNVYDEPPSDTSIYANPSSTAEDTHRENFPCLVKKQSYLMRSRKEQEVKPPQRRLSRATSKLNSSYGASTNRNSANNLITPFDNVKEGLSRTIRDLECNDWEKNVSAFKGLIRLLRYHNDVVESSLHPLSVLMAKHILNLRSQVSRAACQAAGELFAIPRRGLDAELDDITQPLLHRTADTNRFLRADADAALDIMCDRLAPHKVVFVATGKSASHASALVRGTCARLLSRLVHRVGRDKIFSLNKDYRDRVLTTGAKFLQEGSLETRNYAKQIFQELNKHDNFSRTIVEVLPSRTMRNIEKTLRSIH